METFLRIFALLYIAFLFFSLCKISKSMKELDERLEKTRTKIGVLQMQAVRLREMINEEKKTP